MATTIVNSNAPRDTPGSGMAYLVGIIFLIMIIALLIYYGIPYIKSSINRPQVNIPNHVDVNIKNTK